MRKMRSAIELVMRKVRRTETCWIFEGPIRGPNNQYGVVKVGGRSGKALYCHRISYEHFKGPIPSHLEILHLCNNPRCVNPEHLKADTRQRNVEQAIKDGLFKPVEAQRTGVIMRKLNQKFDFFNFICEE